MISCGIQKMIF